MSREVEFYNVELRVHFERQGEDDYTEDDYEFDTRKKAMTFANENAGEVHDVREYYKDTDGYGNSSKSIW
tara:strand:- start:128 stop:337 length:210 start_codon:yes stop_codon:yes gene_type:complete